MTQLTTKKARLKASFTVNQVKSSKGVVHNSINLKFLSVPVPMGFFALIMVFKNIPKTLADF